MTATASDLRFAASWLEAYGGRGNDASERVILARVSEYLTNEAVMRAELEARQRTPDRKLVAMKRALGKVWAAKGHPPAHPSGLPTGQTAS